ncbi:MAG: PepSY domain-containing protein [Pseudomonadota bacterium]
MGLLKWSVRIHKWVALVVGVQIVLWIAGGLVMSAIPIEQVRGEHKVSEWTVQPFDPARTISLEEAANAASLVRVKTATLGHVLGKPVWRLTSDADTLVTIDARTARIISPIDENTARQIAEADYSRDAEIEAVSLVSDPPAEYGRPGPVWQVRFDDPGDTTLYIHPERAEVLARRSSTWRFYDFFWKLHVMDYDDGESFNHPLLITAAGAAIFVALSGMLLLIIKTRRSILVWRNRRHSA